MKGSLRHELKTIPTALNAIVAGLKHHDVRRVDRVFAEGDELLLRCFAPDVGYTGHETLVRITSITPPDTDGLPTDVAVLSIEPAVPTDGVAKGMALAADICLKLGTGARSVQCAAAIMEALSAPSAEPEDDETRAKVEFQKRLPLELIERHTPRRLLRSSGIRLAVFCPRLGCAQRGDLSCRWQPVCLVRCCVRAIYF